MAKSIHTPEYRLLLKWLRERREAEGLSMRDVGAKLHLPHSWVGKIETGERRLDVAEFVRLCRALQADPHAGLDVVARTAPYPSVETQPIKLVYAAADPRRRR
jgi:transcriptional regulator with XRE-family HTH domain